MSILLLGAKETVCAQSIIQDSCICYTDRQDQNCLRCLMQEEKKDSIITIREVQVSELRESFDGAVSVIEDLRLESILKDEKIVRLKTHRKILLSVSGGLIAVLIISFLIP